MGASRSAPLLRATNGSISVSSIATSHQWQHLGQLHCYEPPMGASRSAPLLRATNGSISVSSIVTSHQWQHLGQLHCYEPPMAASRSAPLLRATNGSISVSSIVTSHQWHSCGDGVSAVHEMTVPHRVELNPSSVTIFKIISCWRNDAIVESEAENAHFQPSE